MLKAVSLPLNIKEEFTAESINRALLLDGNVRAPGELAELHSGNERSMYLMSICMPQDLTRLCVSLCSKFCYEQMMSYIWR